MIKIKPGAAKSFNLSELFLESVAVSTRNPSGYAPIQESFAIRFEVTDKQNLFISLDSLDRDLDIYLSREYELDANENPITFPYSSSTNYGVEEEVVFAQLPRGEYYLIVRDNADETSADTFSGTLRFDSRIFDDEIAHLPNDPLLERQWYLFNKGDYSTFDDSNLVRVREHDGILPNADIRAPEAWRKKYSASGVIVAVVDEGIEVNHPDLRNNIWRNENEKNIVDGKGDHDGNGYDNDVQGWNFGNNTNDPSPLVQDLPASHGTHVAGTIGASGNNEIGITGVAWDVQIMPLSVENPNSSGFGNIDKAIQYAIDNNADIINMSFGKNIKMRPAEAMTYMRANGRPALDAPKIFRLGLGAISRLFKQAENADTLMIIAAGNDGGKDSSLAQWGGIGNLDQSFSTWNFLAYFYNNAVNISSSDGMSQLSPYTNIGLSVDLAAPGGNMWSGAQYGVLSTMPMGYKTAMLNEIRNKAEKEGFDPSDIGSWNRRLQNDWHDANSRLIVQDGSDYGYSQGTSMAAPVVSGAAALIKAVNNQLSANDIRQILLSSATPNHRLKGLAGQNGLQLNLEAALDLAENWQGKKSFYDLQKGNQKDNRLLATTSNSWLIGRAGDDLLRGNKGDDLIHGGAGDDLIVPGEGLDRIRGGRGEDVIRYYHSDESPIARPDRIAMDAADKIDISALDGNPDKSGVQRLKFIGATNFSGVPGQLMAKSNGFFVDLDGDAFADFGVLFTNKLGFEIGREHFLL